jgi:thiamine-monophosphate kinase
VGTDAFDVGWKALAVNLSDLAAMGAVPAWGLLALTLPTADAAYVTALADGFAQLAAPHRLALVGGDTTRGPLAVTVAVHGFLPAGQALARSGARPGDVVMVTGTLGDAAAALQWLQGRWDIGAGQEPYRDALLERLNRPVPRLAAGSALRGVAHACIDVSDGLLADLGHICTASNVAAEIEPELIPRSAALRALCVEEAGLAFALTGGDDYELCFTVPAELAGEVAENLARLGCGATRIGRIVEGQGVRVHGTDGAWHVITRGGWEHFNG